MLKKIRRILKNIKNKIGHKKEDKILNPEWIKIKAGPIVGMNFFITHNWDEMAKGEYDDFIFNAIDQQGITLSDSTIWDVGAHIGYHTLAFSKLAGKGGKVCAFEPNPYNVERLKKNLDSNPLYSKNVDIHEFALSDTDELHEFMLNSNVDNTKSSGSYLDYGSRPSDRYSKEVYKDFLKIQVQVFKPDTLISQYNIPAPKLIKLDIEGAEVRFIKGAFQLIDSYKPIFIIEVHNIQNMFYISDILFHKQYELILLNDSVRSSSRCFILAMNKISK